MQNSAQQLKAAASQHVVSVGIQGSQPIFLQYKGGIFNSPECGTKLDHVVNVVGYGNENGQDYWIVRNSFGTQWGEQGYIRFAMQEGQGVCGINMKGTFPMTN
jgi:C1A family cysteine protease